jgi:hypothetical protein
MFHGRGAARAFPAQLSQTGRGPLSGPPRSLCYVPKSATQRSRRVTEKHREVGLVERIGNNEFNLIVPRAAQHFQRVRQQFRNRVERLDRASRAPRQVFFLPYSRITSGIPGNNFWQASVVASGVESLGPIPVPPVVKINSAAPSFTNETRRSRIDAGSSGSTACATTSQPSCRQRSRSAGPEASPRTPCDTESLIVRMTTRMRKG